MAVVQAPRLWRSKLGRNYDASYIHDLDTQHSKILQDLRRRQDNRLCADCCAEGTVWAILNHGCFVCMRCASLHRSLGTHVSICKGCTGTYLWGPDEIATMRRLGNNASNHALGSPRPPPGSESDEMMRRFLVDKYEKRRWAPTLSMTVTATVQMRDAAPQKVHEDLITFEDAPEEQRRHETDFFGNYGL